MNPSSTARWICVLGWLLFVALAGSLARAQMWVENLNRGLMAARQDAGYYLSWRLLGNEPYDTGFHVYRGGARLTAEPIIGATIYADRDAPCNSGYTVRAVRNGVEQPTSEPARILNHWQGDHAAYFDIPLHRPAPGSHGGNYAPNDASVGDLTGDGVYEIVFLWEPSNARDNAHRGITDDVYLDAVTLEGDLLWRINLGPNIRAGAHYTQFLVYDFDGNGRAEPMVKTAPGTRDGTGAHLRNGPAAEADHSAVYRIRRPRAAYHRPRSWRRHALHPHDQELSLSPNLHAL